MLVLAADTTADYCAAALWRGGETLAARSCPTTHGHAELLAPMVKAVLADAGVMARACDRFCAVTGPGSFTGVRVGVSFMRALALAAGKPALGVDAFTVRAAASAARLGPAKGAIIVALDSRRGTAYVREMPGDGGAGAGAGGAGGADGGKNAPGPAVEESLDALAARLARAPLARLTGGVCPPGFTPGFAGDETAAAGSAMAAVAAGSAMAAVAAGSAMAAAAAAIAAAADPKDPASAPRPFYLRPADAKPAAPGAA